MRQGFTVNHLVASSSSGSAILTNYAMPFPILSRAGATNRLPCVSPFKTAQFASSISNMVRFTCHRGNVASLAPSASANGAEGPSSLDAGTGGDIELGAKRRTAWNKGVPISDSVREKVSESLKRKWQDPAFKAAVSGSLKGRSPWNKGRTLSEETREKMRLAKLRHTVSRDTRQKMSAARRGKPLSPSAAAAVSAALTGRPKTEEHKQAIAATQRRRHAAVRVLRAVESVYEASSDTVAPGNHSQISNRMPLMSGMSTARELAFRRQGKTQILNAFKAELREYRSLQEELSPWTTAFVERHNRKPTIVDVQRTGIEWLISRYKQYVMLRERLFNESSLLRNRLDVAAPELDAMTSELYGNTPTPPQTGTGPMNANGPSMAARSAVASRVQAAMQYKANRSQDEATAKLVSHASKAEFSQGTAAAAAAADSVCSTGVSNATAAGATPPALAKQAVVAQGIRTPSPRVRAAMIAAMEYRQKTAQAVKTAATAAAAAAKVGVSESALSPLVDGSSSSAFPCNDGSLNAGSGERDPEAETEHHVIGVVSGHCAMDAALPADVVLAHAASHRACLDLEQAEAQVRRALRLESESESEDAPEQAAGVKPVGLSAIKANKGEDRHGMIVGIAPA